VENNLVKNYGKYLEPLQKYSNFLLPVLVIIISFNVVKALKSAKAPPELKTAAKIERKLSIFVEPVRRKSISLSVHAQGEVKATTEVNLVAQVSGLIVSVSPSFIEGRRVNAGATLLQIDDTDHKVAIVQAKARVAEAKLELAKAHADAEVAHNQLKGNNHSDLALRKPYIAQAMARLASAKAQLEQAKINLTRTHVTVPHDSLIRTKLVDVGQYVSVGTSLGKAFAINNAEVRLALTDKQLASLGLPIGYSADDGTGPAVDLTAIVAGELRHWQGSLVRLDGAIDPDTRLIYGYAQVKDPYGTGAESQSGMPLAIGLYVAAQIDGKYLADAYVIPRNSLRRGNKVFVIEGEKLYIREVTIIHRNTDTIVVKGAINNGDLLVVSPVKAAVNGMSALAVVKEKNQTNSLAVAMEAMKVGEK
jgi:RND family efflux transporter MFP subunit